MLITEKPIIEYLKKCICFSHRQSYKWVMVLLARERDAIKSYEDIRNYWNSFHDLTADKILFVFSIFNIEVQEKNINVKEYNNGEYRKCLLELDEYFDEKSKNTNQEHKMLKIYIDKAVDNNSNYISELCEEYQIKENQVPSILLFPINYNSSCDKISNPVIIPLIEDNIYDSIKELIEIVGSPLRHIKNIDEKLDYYKNKIEILKKDLEKCKLTKQEQRLFNDKKFLSELKISDKDRNRIKKAMEEKDISICDLYSHPIKGCLKQYINLCFAYRNIEDDVKQKVIEQNRLINDEKRIKLKINEMTREKKDLEKIINIKLNEFKEKREQEKFYDILTIKESNAYLKHGAITHYKKRDY